MRRHRGFGTTVDIFGSTSPAAAPSVLQLPKNLPDTLSKVATGATDWYSTLAAIDSAKLNRSLLKAQGQAAVATARAGGVNAAQTALVGLPSPSLLVVGGLALAALVLLKR